MKLSSFFNRVISSCFYLLLFLVPLTFAGNTSELFEFNKMWLTFGLTIIISLAWISKMILEKRVSIRRTPLDIPIILFFVSQIIATILSLDRYVSWWGYYSRFNGGLLSTITYILLYYAFISNLEKKHVIRMLHVSLFSGLIVALWGLPSHFGYDPTCFVFRGNFDVSCWTDAFQPKVRIFSTLGQPDWMAAYLAVLIPISIGFYLIKNYELRIMNKEKIKNIILAIYYLLLTTLFYIDLLFTRARSGFIAVWISIIFFFIILLWSKKIQIKEFLIHNSYFLILVLVITFFVGTPIAQLDKFTLAAIQQRLHTPATTQSKKPAPAAPAPISGEFGGTDSGRIRLFVWQGALKVWEHYPLFGSGVETFAFAYYKFRPAGHNLTSEWDYLYNKAHNEYLNYLATTGIFGLGSYLAIIGGFFLICAKKIKNQKSKIKNTMQNVKSEKEKLSILMYHFDFRILIFALVSSFTSILITNFFGFSVVIINIYFFLIPAFVLLLDKSSIKDQYQKQKMPVSPWQVITILVLLSISGYMLFTLYQYWISDTSYAYGSNLDHAGYYQQANSYLRTAVESKPQEPIFSDELSINDAVLATAYVQKDATAAAQLAKEAMQLSDKTITEHPNNVVYWKTRVRLFYSLAQFNQQALQYALQAIQKAHELAPTDAKISYNLGLLYAQTGDTNRGIQTMEDTIILKKDYYDAYYALGLFYRQAAIDKNGTVINKDMEQKAVAEMHFILDHFDKDDKQALDSLKKWQEM